MSEKHILCGFDIPEFEKRMKLLLKEQGYEATTYIQLSKKGVKDFLEQNPKCDTVILLEASNLKKSYTAEEIAALTDKREINVIVVLSSRHIGTDYMKILYVAGVTNAIFQMGRKDGASAKDIVERIIYKRNRQEARRYYGIEHLDLDPTVIIDMDAYADYYRKLHKDEQLLVNYLKICADMSPKQIADFTKRIPAEDRDYLAQFVEFHMLVDAVKNLGVVMKVKKPRKTKVGMNVTPEIAVSNLAVKYSNYEELFSLPKAIESEEEKHIEQQEPSQKASYEEHPYQGMSMEELLLAAQTIVVPAWKEKELGPKEAEMDSQTVLEEARRLKEETIEKQRALDLEQKKLADEKRAFEDERLSTMRELRKEEQRIKQEAEEDRKKREKEAKAEVERRFQEEKERVKLKSQEQTSEEAELYTSDKQFSGGFLIGLLLLCGLAAGVLFVMPHLKQFGIF